MQPQLAQSLQAAAAKVPFAHMKICTCRHLRLRMLVVQEYQPQLLALHQGTER
jgi:hypothetical protein